MTKLSPFTLRGPTPHSVARTPDSTLRLTTHPRVGQLTDVSQSQQTESPDHGRRVDQTRCQTGEQCLYQGHAARTPVAHQLGHRGTRRQVRSGQVSWAQSAGHGRAEKVCKPAQHMVGLIHHNNER